MRALFRIRWRRGLQGAFLALGAPLGWLLFRYFNGSAALDELRTNPWLYLYFLIGTAAAFSVFGFLIGIQEEKLEEISITDSLTGLHNLRYFRMRLEEEYASAKRTKRPISLMMLDLDFFKRINDRFGHGVGDRMLKAAADAMKSVSRKEETTARIGGEEFAIILPDISGENALRAAERVREAVKNVALKLTGGEAVSVTVSVGLFDHSAPLPSSPEELCTRVDRALYLAKEQGRDRVVLAESLAEPKAGV
ncbi:MAG: GGDEF domain-containing protein [Spirochaetia bacterium]|nr:GGDEF domain-containing protein [Spirochaetia bacterium]